MILELESTQFAALVKPVATLKKCCSAATGDPRTPGLAVLDPVIDITADPEDRLGTYTARVTLSDGTRSATASEKFQLVAGARKADAAPAAAPADAPDAPRRRSRANQDARACLDLATNAAVARCAEKFR